MSQNIRPTLATVDLDALSDNLKAVRGALPDGVQVLAAVKGDAYGHGAIACSRLLEDAGVDWFGVALVEEGRALRDAGITHPILCLGGVGATGAEEAVAHNLTPLVSDLDEAIRIDTAAAAAGQVMGVHLKLDTGMGRLGVPMHLWAHFLDRISNLQSIRIDGICSHLAESESADGTDGRVFTLEQARRFQDAVSTARHRGFSAPLIHLANSGAILEHPDLVFDMVRPGLLLYGYSPSSRDCPIPVRPVLTVRTEVLVVRDLPAGVGLSYGRKFRTERPSRIATLPVGYADGYPRALSGQAQVLIHGHRVPVCGTVCMDMCMVDVTDLPMTVRAGDEVVLLGEQGAQSISAWDLAEWAGTIPYEILAGFSARIPRHN